MICCYLVIRTMIVIVMMAEIKQVIKNLIKSICFPDKHEVIEEKT